MRHTTGTVIAALLVLSGTRLLGGDIYVDAEKGDDSGTGRVKTIARAIQIAAGGDTIHLVPARTPFKEMATFHNKSGAPGRPIVLDGHGATLSGCEPLRVEDWETRSPGLYRNSKLSAPQDSIIGRYYFIFDGKMHHMGRTSKGAKKPWIQPDQLQPGEWTYSAEERAFYIKIRPGQRLDECRIETPMRANGVAFAGECNHIVIRNITATHVWNDGFNIHGKTRDIVFENIKAIDCGDDGLSAHDDCEVRVDNFVSVGNSTGICNVGNSTSVNERVFVRGCLAHGLYFLDSNKHIVRNSIVYASGEQSVVVRGDAKEGVCTVQMENVAVIRDDVRALNETRSGRVGDITVGRRGVLEAKRLTLYGLGLQVAGGTGTLMNSVLGGEPLRELVISADAKWRADGNVYGLAGIRLDQSVYAGKDFAAYCRATGQDGASRWSAVEFAKPVCGRVTSPKLQKGQGADMTLIPKGE